MNNLSLNGFHLELSAKSLTFHKLDFPDNKGLRVLRETHPDWFIHWRDGIVYALPKVGNPAVTLGAETTDLCTDHLQLIAARITDLLPTKFPGYPAFQRRPFSFVAKRKDEEIIKAVTKYLKARPSLREAAAQPLAVQEFLLMLKWTAWLTRRLDSRYQPGPLRGLSRGSRRYRFGMPLMASLESASRASYLS